MTDREIKLSPAPQAAREAREFVSRQLTELGLPDLIDNAVIIVTELVANSIKYAPQGPIWVSLRHACGHTMLEVQDSSAQLPIFKDADLIAESGRGMHVVQTLAALLGWAPIPGGKAVWTLLQEESTKAR